jgi:transaldolase
VLGIARCQYFFYFVGALLCKPIVIGAAMKATQQLHNLGQSLWLDNITRDLLDSGTLKRYIDELSVTGLTSNPTIFDEAIGNTEAYDQSIRAKASSALSDDALFMDVALEDLRRAADLFLPIHAATRGVDGWVSMEVSPLLAQDTEATIAAAKEIHAAIARPNCFVKIPGTPAGVLAIEEVVFAGVPVNVTLLFSRNQYIAAAEAYVRAIERRLAAGLDPRIASVASVFVSRWDKAVSEKVPQLANQLGIAVSGLTYRAYRDLLNSPRWQKLAARGAKPQRLLWASTGTKDPKAPDTLYIETLAAPDTVNTMPEKTLLAFADHGRVLTAMASDGKDAQAKIANFVAAGVDIEALASRLQDEGAQSFVKSWHQLLKRIADKRKTAS